MPRSRDWRFDVNVIAFFRIRVSCIQNECSKRETPYKIRPYATYLGIISILEAINHLLRSIEPLFLFVYFSSLSILPSFLPSPSIYAYIHPSKSNRLLSLFSTIKNIFPSPTHDAFSTPVTEWYGMEIRTGIYIK